MFHKIKNFIFGFDARHRPNATKYIFGATSSIITSLALIIGFNTSANAKISIIGSLLVIALADNISDMLGIHIYQETEGIKTHDVWLSSSTNFLTRFFVSLAFILIVVFLPMKSAVIVALIYGLLTLAIFSYVIADIKKMDPVNAIIEHLLIAIVIILISNFLGGWIIHHYS